MHARDRSWNLDARYLGILAGVLESSVCFNRKVFAFVLQHTVSIIICDYNSSFPPCLNPTISFQTFLDMSSPLTSLSTRFNNHVNFLLHACDSLRLIGGKDGTLMVTQLAAII